MVPFKSTMRPTYIECVGELDFLGQPKRKQIPAQDPFLYVSGHSYFIPHKPGNYQEYWIENRLEGRTLMLFDHETNCQKAIDKYLDSEWKVYIITYAEACNLIRIFDCYSFSVHGLTWEELNTSSIEKGLRCHTHVSQCGMK